MNVAPEVRALIKSMHEDDRRLGADDLFRAELLGQHFRVHE